MVCIFESCWQACAYHPQAQRRSRPPPQPGLLLTLGIVRMCRDVMVGLVPSSPPSLLFLITRRSAPEIRSWSGFRLRACHTNCCHVFRIWNSVGLQPGRCGGFCRTGFICASRCATGLFPFASEVFWPLNVGVLHGTGSKNTLYLRGLLEFIFNSKSTRLQNKMKKHETFMGVWVPVNTFTQHLGLTGWFDWIGTFHELGSTTALWLFTYNITPLYRCSID